MSTLATRIYHALHDFRTDCEMGEHAPAPPGIENLARLLQEAADALHLANLPDANQEPTRLYSAEEEAAARNVLSGFSFSGKLSSGAEKISEREAKKMTVIQKIRQNQGLSRLDLARKTDNHPTVIGRLERGEEKCGAGRQALFAGALDVPVEAVFDERGWPLLVSA